MMNGSWMEPRNPPYCPGMRLDGPGMLSQFGRDTLGGTPWAAGLLMVEDCARSGEVARVRLAILIRLIV